MTDSIVQNFYKRLPAPAPSDALEQLMDMLFYSAVYVDKLDNRLMPASRGLAVDWYAKPCPPGDPRAALWSFEGAMIAAVLRSCMLSADFAHAFNSHPREMYNLACKWALQLVSSMFIPKSLIEKCQIGPDPVPENTVDYLPYEQEKLRFNWVLSWAQHPQTTTQDIRFVLEMHLEAEEYKMEKKLRGGEE